MIKTNSKETQNVIRPVSEGDIVKGEIIDFSRSSVFIDLGPQGTGIIYGREFYEVKSAFKKLEIGHQITGEIISIENEDGYREISVKRVIHQKVWKDLKEKKEKGENLEVKIFGANRGGLLTKIHDLPAFIPASQLATNHFPRVENANKSKILSKLEELISQTLKVRILDLNPKEEKIILSEKLEELEKNKNVLDQYKVGDIIEGEITGLADFGAFISFGKLPLEGLIHVSELDWGLVQNPAEIVKVGQKIKAKIIDISHNRVSLSLKELKKSSSKKVAKSKDEKDN
jgi:small subunit ribosomal protein S1